MIAQRKMPRHRADVLLIIRLASEVHSLYLPLYKGTIACQNQLREERPSLYVPYLEALDDIVVK